MRRGGRSILTHNLSALPHTHPKVHHDPSVFHGGDAPWEQHVCVLAQLSDDVPEFKVRAPLGEGGERLLSSMSDTS